MFSQRTAGAAVPAHPPAADGDDGDALLAGEPGGEAGGVEDGGLSELADAREDVGAVQREADAGAPALLRCPRIVLVRPIMRCRHCTGRIPGLREAQVHGAASAAARGGPVSGVFVCFVAIVIRGLLVSNGRELVLEQDVDPLEPLAVAGAGRVAEPGLRRGPGALERALVLRFRRVLLPPLALLRRRRRRLLLVLFLFPDHARRGGIPLGIGKRRRER